MYTAVMCVCACMCVRACVCVHVCACVRVSGIHSSKVYTMITGRIDALIASASVCNFYVVARYCGSSKTGDSGSRVPVFRS